MHLGVFWLIFKKMEFGSRLWIKEELMDLEDVLHFQFVWGKKLWTWLLMYWIYIIWVLVPYWPEEWDLLAWYHTRSYELHSGCFWASWCIKLSPLRFRSIHAWVYVHFMKVECYILKLGSFGACKVTKSVTLVYSWLRPAYSVRRDFSCCTSIWAIFWS